MNIMTHGATGADRRTRIETALADYPHVDRETLADLIHWFRKEASALDVGTIASNPRLSAPYESFKADHLDRLKGASLLWSSVIIAVVAMCLALILWSSF